MSGRCLPWVSELTRAHSGNKLASYDQSSCITGFLLGNAAYPASTLSSSKQMISALTLGAHVGNRLRVWSNLGARIVGIEPQPHCMRLLKRWYGHHPNITLVEGGVGSAPGIRTLFMSRFTPTVTTLSPGWIDAVRQRNTFANVRWDTALPVAFTTLVSLITQYGEPRFCKIDAEGYELEVLRGLSKSITTLSFEYNSAAMDIAVDCVECLGELATYEFNWSLGESHRLRSSAWLSPDEMITLLTSIPVDGRTGDVYARRISC